MKIKIIHSRTFTLGHSSTRSYKCNMHTSTAPWPHPKWPGIPNNVGLAQLAAWVFYVTDRAMVTRQLGQLGLT